MIEEKTESRKAGRPLGQTKANGGNVSPGRPPALSKSEQKRCQHWQAWWQTRPAGKPSAYLLAQRMELSADAVQAYAKGSRSPGPVALANLESLSAAYGYEPLTADYQFP